MNITFVGQHVTVKESMQHDKISQAGNIYQLKFIEILEPTFVISLLPIFVRIKPRLCN